MKDLLLFRNTPNTYYVSRFRKEANDLGISFQEIPLDEVKIEFFNKRDLTFSYGGGNINFSNSVVLIRPSNKYRYLRYGLLSYFYKKNIRSLNLAGYIENIGTDNKLEQYIRLSIGGFPIVESLYTNQLEMRDNEYERHIVKPIQGSKGEGIEKLSTFLQGKESSKLYDYMIQQYISTEGHYRVVVLGDKILGGIFLKKKKASLISNTGEPKIFEVNEYLHKMSLKVAEFFKFELCGIDYIFDKSTNTWFILEVNMMPNFEKFEKATGINFAGKVLKHLATL